MKSFNYDNLKFNSQALCNYNNKKLIAVVKNNGYGCGLIDVVNSIKDEQNVDLFMVTTAEETLLINQHLNDVSVLISNPLSTAELNSLKTVDNVHLMIDSFAYLQNNSEILKNFNLHLKINSSMNRFGVDDKEEALACVKYCISNNLKLVGLCTHISIEDEDEVMYNEIINKFASVYDELSRIVEFEYIHAENSYTYMRKDERLSMCTHCRIGLLLYGYNYTKNGLYLKPILTLTTKVIKIRHLQKGETISYGVSNVVDRDMTIAICDYGYGNGLLRSRNLYPVKINNKLYDIFGVISMSHMYVVVDDSVKIGDTVYLYDEDELSVVMHHFKEGIAASTVLCYLN